MGTAVGDRQVCTAEQVVPSLHSVAEPIPVLAALTKQPKSCTSFRLQICKMGAAAELAMEHHEAAPVQHQLLLPPALYVKSL